MSSHITIDEALHPFREQLSKIAQNLHTLTLHSANPILSQQVDNLKQRISEPFMFVVVGEVKAGKSSFVNALLESDKQICKTAPDPCTQIVQQIVYGVQEGKIQINEFLEKRFVPIDILKGIAIVDTPGTGAIIQQHQEITESFIPVSDLIMFVFMSKNPFHHETWEFFNYIHQKWHKQIVFVLQQSDLMEEEELEVNKRWVLEFAQKRGLDNPPLFCVSARREMKGQKAESGFEAIRHYIDRHVTGGKAYLQKLQNSIHTLQTLCQQIQQDLTTRKAQAELDQRFRQHIQAILDEQSSYSQKEVAKLGEVVLAAYAKQIQEHETLLRERLVMKSLLSSEFRSLFGWDKNLNTWLNEFKQTLQKQLTQAVEKTLNEGVEDLARHIGLVIERVDLKIQENQKLLMQKNLTFSHINDKRNYILREVQQQFQILVSYSDKLPENTLSNNRLSSNLALGGGLAAVGVVLTSVTHAMMFDITGGILTTLGLLFAGGTLWWNAETVLKEYRDKTDAAKADLKKSMIDKLSEYIRNLKSQMQDNFKTFDAHLSNEVHEVADIDKQLKVVQQQLFDLEMELSRNFP